MYVKFLFNLVQICICYCKNLEVSLFWAQLI